MSRDDIQKLLGGYATGTLTPEEQQALFDAALTDQELFDALAREEALRDVLSDPVARAHVLAAIDDVRAPWYRNWWRPMVVMATAASLVVAVAVYTRSPKVSRIAKVELPRFRPPVEARSQPMLPEPPELRRESAALKSLAIPLPAVRPVAPAPSAAPAPTPARGSSLLTSDRFTVNGSISSGTPTQQQAPQPQSQTQARFENQLSVPMVPSARNALLAPADIPVRGTVIDATGAAVPSANVLVKSLATGETVKTATDAKGEFIAPEKPGSTYEISASAPGFKDTTVSRTAPVNGTPEPVNLRLDVGAASETVAVTAAAPMVAEARATGGGGGGARGAPGVAGGSLAEMKKAKAAPLPALEYHLFRRVAGRDVAGRDVAEVPADGTVPAGSSLILRVTPAADGALRVVEGARVIASPKVRGGVMHETTLPRFDKPGRVELQVYFSAQTESKFETAPFVTIAFNVQ